jgi:hypothetical protein
MFEKKNGPARRSSGDQLRCEGLALLPGCRNPRGVCGELLIFQRNQQFATHRIVRWMFYIVIGLGVTRGSTWRRRTTTLFTRLVSNKPGQRRTRKMRKAIK